MMFITDNYRLHVGQVVICDKLIIRLENVHWISIPVHIGDPISVAYGGATWRVMFEKIVGLCRLSPGVATVSPSRYAHC